MTKRIAVGIASALIAAVIARTGSPMFASSGFIDLDAVVADSEGRPVPGLRAEDFLVREDDRPVPILTAEEITSDAGGSATEVRSLALVLDDLAVLPAYTVRMQDLARAFLARADVGDRIAVLRLSDRAEDPFFGHLGDALLRIRNYAAQGEVSFDEHTVDAWLKMVTNISRQFGDDNGRRRTIVAVGLPVLLDPVEPVERFHHGTQSRWVDAVSNAARSNAALYVIDPSGIAGPVSQLGAGLTEQTGGMLFRTLDLARAFDQIWRDISHYYVLSYVPQRPQRLHSIRVSAKRPGVRVRARRLRGE